MNKVLITGLGCFAIARNFLWRSTLLIKDDEYSDKFGITNSNFGYCSVIKYWNDGHEIHDKCAEWHLVWFSRPTVFHQKHNGQRKNIGENFMFIPMTKDGKYKDV